MKLKNFLVNLFISEIDLSNFISKMEYKKQIKNYRFLKIEKKEMIKMFWSHELDNFWLYLDPEFIMKRLQYAKVSDFYNMVVDIYKKNVDYKKINDNSYQITVKTLKLILLTELKLNTIYFLNEKTIIDPENKENVDTMMMPITIKNQ